MLMELGFSLKSVYHFIDETSDNEVIESKESKATPSPLSTPSVHQQSEASKEKKKRKYHFIEEISDNDDNESGESAATPSLTDTPSVPQQSEASKEKKKKKKKIEISPVFTDTDFYKSTVHSRLTVFGIMYAGRNFIKVKSHQPHQEDFMPYLETLIDTGLDGMKWKELVHILKVMWRRYKSAKKLKDFEISMGYGRTIYDSYLEFEK